MQTWNLTGLWDALRSAFGALFDIGWNTLPWPLFLLALVLSLYAAQHALLNKRHPNSAVAWIVVVLLLPFYGPLVYGLFGVNRVRQRARAMQYDWKPPGGSLPGPAAPGSQQRLAEIGAAITGAPLCGGNRVEALFNGEGAYPGMLEAVNGARHRIWLCTYIFETDRCGRAFIDALAAARERGVEVRVLVDGIGEYYSWPRPRVSRLLARRGVPCARFMPPRLIPPAFYINLRNHRKLLIVDDDTCFTGGMNIGERHLAQHPDRSRASQDVHFRIVGPLTGQLAHLFAHDWQFATGELLEIGAPPQDVVAPVWCRAVVDGPDENLDRLRMLLSAAISHAQHRVCIMSPYFLPTPDLVSAMAVAALAGVRVEVVLPASNNLPFVHWAAVAAMPRLIARGVRFWMQQPPFAHSKLFMVDDSYALVGSANIDVRSLRLNFEVGVEIHDRPVVTRLTEHFDRVRAEATPVTREALDQRSLPVRVRDAAAWLFSPYL